MFGKGKTAAKRRQFVAELIGFLLSLLIIIPFAMIVINSFKTHRAANKMQFSLTGISWEQIVENYTSVFKEAGLLNSMLNSLIVTSLSTLVIVFFASMAAYIVVRRRTKAMNILNNIIIVGLTLPVAMVPTYFMLSKMNLTKGIGAYIGAILVYGAVNFAFAYFLYTGFIKGLPKELDEAAIIDGITPTGLFFKIVMPLIKPATVTVVISEVMTVWNDFGISLYLLNSPNRSTAVLSTYMFMGQKTSEWNLLFADVVLVSLPVIILYLCLQKYIVGGLTAGAVKG